MITAIREVRRAKGMTLDDVARACVPPTTAQTIGRLETGMRTVSVVWLNRIAAALGVSAADLVKLPDRGDVTVAAVLDASGAHAPRHAATSVPPLPGAGMVALRVSAGVGDYRAGDDIWCETLAPADFHRALNRDVLVPRPAGRFLFGRLIGRDGPGSGEGGGKLQLLPLGAGARQQVVADPPWIAHAVRLIRTL
jgi:transcriptional regulator with XRE-family HTH domain